jgi:acyl-CoA-binding protein
LELYALHKQAVSGDAPNSFPVDSTVAEKARYQAWKSKRGLSPEEAMAAYTAECDRQVRVYGSASSSTQSTSRSLPQTPMTTPNVSDPASGNGGDDMSQPRGIAAIPLLCAAAAESRVAYLRRLSRTQQLQASAWWSRQEPLCGTPGTITSLPEAILLAVATLVEYLSLQSSTLLPFPPSVVQSFLWPLHNISLAAWMLLILVFTSLASAISLMTTILWGSRRTGLSLQKIWTDEVSPSSTAVHTLCQRHQPISVRVMGLLLLPYTAIVQGLCLGFVEPMAGSLVNSLVYAIVMLSTWWYWIMFIPFTLAGIYVAAFWSGFCFALIEMAGV